MGKLFGTDGIRGIANVDITPNLAFDLGVAGAYVVTKEKAHIPKIIVGIDTRISADMIESALIAGMCSVGADVYVTGVIPTPGIAYLVRKYNFDAGVVISASHNSFEDNGIKFFSSDGYKLPDETENEIEYIMNNYLDKIEKSVGTNIGRKHMCREALNDYIDFLESTLDGVRLDGLKVALDCANGATYLAAPLILERLGAEVTVLNNMPDGININKDCGSTHMEMLQKFVKENNVDVGFAFDGDGDRCLAVDENGNIVDGDAIMSILASSLKEKCELNNNTLVVTVMSNLGLSAMCEKFGINIEKTGVGDRYVLEKMLEGGYNLGGEQSGHIIFLKYNTAGDGILTALQLMSVIKEKGKPFSQVNCYMEAFPQIILNAKVNNSKKYSYYDDEIIKIKISELEKKFEKNGRVLIRPSGTESVIRVMIEGKDKQMLKDEAYRFVKLIEERLA